MAKLESSNSPPNPSFAAREASTKFLRSISTKEPPSLSIFPSFPPRLSMPNTNTRPFPSSLKNFSPSNDNATDNETTYKCISSIIKKDGQILSMAISNGLIYTGSAYNVVRLWKLPKFNECGQLKTRACLVVALEVSYDQVYAAYGDGKIRVWRRTWDGDFRHVRLATIPTSAGYVWSYIGRKDKMVKHMGPITSLAVNISEDILYSASPDKTVKVWRLSDHKCIETIQAHSEPINAIVAADDGILYTASDDATVKVWRWNFCSSDRSHSLSTTQPAKHSPIKALSLTSDNGVLYGGCSDGYIRYWLKGWFSGQLQYGGELLGHTHAVMCIANAGNYVISGSADSTSRVWARESEGQHVCLAVLVGHRGPIRSVTAFVVQLEDVDDDDEDSCTICTGSLDGVIKLWGVTHSCSKESGGLSRNDFEYFELQQGQNDS